MLGCALVLAVTASAALPQQPGGGSRGPDRIVGGSDASTNGHDWLVSLQVSGQVAQDFGRPNNDFGRGVCGGTLIAPSWVLTAAHCVSDGVLTNPATWSVLLGETNLLDDDGTRIQVSDIIRHPSYDAATHHNDLALMRLASPATGFAFMPLAQDGDAALSSPGVDATIMGWGSTSEGDAGTEQLQDAVISVLGDSKCADAPSSVYDGYDGSLMICGGYDEGGVDTCQGDSGGPLIADDASQRVQIGIVSYGDGCAEPGKPGVYTRVGPYFDWIRSHVGGRRLDLMFAIDTTGSMYDDIDAVKVASRVLTAVYGLMFDLRTGLVEYKDHPVEGGEPTDFPSRLDLELSDDPSGFRTALDSLYADGGGDGPESVYSGLMTAIARPWRENVRRAIVLFGDAPPKDPEPVTGFTHSDVVAAARAGFLPAPRLRASGVGPDSIGLFTLKVNSDPETAASFDALAADTGGTSLSVNGAGDVASELSGLLGALAAEPIALPGGPYHAITGQPVTFQGSGQDDDGTIASLSWDIGSDGTVDGGGTSYTHTFTRAGTYPVRLTVTDNDGLNGFAVTSVTVTDPPSPPPPPPPPPRPPLPPPPPLVATFGGSAKSVRVGRSGAFAYRFHATPLSRGTIGLMSIKRVKIGRRTIRMAIAAKPFTALASGNVKVAFRLTPAALATLRKSRALRFSVKVKLGGRAFATQLKLTAPKKR
jgi:hypothetical protein